MQHSQSNTTSARHHQSPRELPWQQHSHTGGSSSGCGFVIRSAGLVSMAVLFWVNCANHPDSSVSFTTVVTDSMLSLPSSFDISRNTVGRSLLRSDSSTTSSTSNTNTETDPSSSASSTATDDDGITEIVTFVDHRKSPVNVPPVQPVIQQQQQQMIANHNNEPVLPVPIANNKDPHLPLPISNNKDPLLHWPRSAIKSLQGWRETYDRKCQDDSVSRDQLLKTIERMIQPPNSSSSKVTTTTTEKTSKKKTIIKRCQYTFLDLGANVGDSLGKFIDSGMDGCEKKGFLFPPKYNITQGVMDQFYDHENALVQFSRDVTRKLGRKPTQSPPRYPENYCSFGVEGNPVFTDRLQKLEDRVMHSNPRPVKRAHFFTETVGAGVDGPTMLYLDTISTDKNYWGSSVLTQPKYVRESAIKHNNGKPIEAKVEGITLSTLVRQTVLHRKGGHLIIKMDIEGGEYAVLQEVHKSGVLCNYVKQGVTVDMLLEEHAPQFEAAKLDMTLWGSFLQDLRKCGVVIQGGMSAGR